MFFIKKIYLVRVFVLGDTVRCTGIFHRVSDPESTMIDPESRIVDPGSGIIGPESRMIGPESRMIGPESRMIGPGSRVVRSRVYDGRQVELGAIDSTYSIPLSL